MTRRWNRIEIWYVISIFETPNSNLSKLSSWGIKQNSSFQVFKFFEILRFELLRLDYTTYIDLFMNEFISYFLRKNIKILKHTNYHLYVILCFIFYYFYQKIYLESHFVLWILILIYSKQSEHDTIRYKPIPRYLTLLLITYYKQTKI